MSINRIHSAAVAALLLAVAPAGAQNAEVEVTRAGLYPIMVPIFTEVAPARFGCTQLEMAAGLEETECGTMQLHEVVKKLNPSVAD